jgi:hypothetical protein
VVSRDAVLVSLKRVWTDLRELEDRVVDFISASTMGYLSEAEQGAVSGYLKQSARLRSVLMAKVGDADESERAGAIEVLAAVVGEDRCARKDRPLSCR